jgi:hypothetical protein
MQDLQKMGVFLPSLFDQGSINSQKDLDLSDVPGLEPCVLHFDWKLGLNMEPIQRTMGTQTGEITALFNTDLNTRISFDQSIESTL